MAVQPPSLADRIRSYAEWGHDIAAVQRLQQPANPELAAVWTWLSELSEWNQDAFIYAALNGLSGLSMRDAMRRKPRKTREIFEGHATRSWEFKCFLASRKGGVQSDYLRVFIGSLLNRGFPIERRGTQTQIAAMANVVLDCHNITSQQVSAILAGLDIPTIRDIYPPE